MGRLNILLFHRLDGHKPHAGAAHGLTDRLGIIGIDLVALHIGLYELGCNQLHHKTLGLQLTRPMVRARSGLHAYVAAWLCVFL